MNYKDYTIKLQDIFNKMSNLSVKLTGDKNKLLKLKVDIESLKKGKSEYTLAYKETKASDVVEMAAFIEAGKNKDKIEESLANVKLEKAIIDSNISKMKIEMELLKSSYKELEVARGKLSNNIIEFKNG